MEVLDIDVGGGCRRIGKEQEDSAGGHWVQARTMLRIIPTGRGEKLYFERTFDFDCPRMPTSFYFRIEFTRPLDKDVNCETSIKRTDRGTGFVDATLMLFIRRREHHEFIEKFDFPKMGPGEDATPVISQSIISNKRARKLYSEHLLVEFGIGVKSCHREQDMWDLAWAEWDMGTHDSEDSSPKKQLCVQSSL